MHRLSETQRQVAMSTVAALTSRSPSHVCGGTQSRLREPRNQLLSMISQAWVQEREVQEREVQEREVQEKEVQEREVQER
jgi:hypothetical protein